MESTMTARPNLRPVRHASLALGLLLTPLVFAAATDLSPVPLWSSMTTVVKPNILFTLDDSGSMGSDYLPDDAGYRMTSGYSGGNFYWAVFGRLSAQCNGLSYDTTIDPDTKAQKVNYLRPVDDKGNVKGATSPTAAELKSLLETTDASARTSWAQPLTAVPAASVISSGTLVVTLAAVGYTASDYFAKLPVTIYDDNNRGRYMVGIVKDFDPATSKVTIDIKQARGTGFTYVKPVIAYNTPTHQLYYTYSGTQPQMSYGYTGATLKKDTFYNECNSTIAPGSTGYGVFTPVIVTPDSPDAERYWLWNKYYSTRMAMMQTSMSLAFKDIDDRFRVGFTTILKKDVSPDARMLNVSDFNAPQKKSFYDDLFAAKPTNSTPLRGALQKAGRYYAKMMPGQDYDPVQYSCQKNFLILSTDGYWNTGDEATDYGPYTIDGSANVGNQDGLGTPRPLFEGGSRKVDKTYQWPVASTWIRTTVTPVSYTLTTAKYVKSLRRNREQIVTSGKTCGGSTPKILATYTESSAQYSNYVVATTTARTDYANMSQAFTYQRIDTTIYNGASVSNSSTVPAPVATGSVKNLGTASPTVYTTSSTAPTTFSAPWVNVSTAYTCVSSSYTPKADVALADVVSGSDLSTSSGSLTTATGTASNTDGAVTTAATGPEVLKNTADKTTGATSDTLADVAMYYYKTDLRNKKYDNCTGALGKDVCTDNVKPFGRDNAVHQHLTTYTISLGNSGNLRYNKDYQTAVPDAKTINDYYYLGDETGFVPARAGSIDWPNPASDGATRIDDLFHAAVNGRGLYFSATNPSSLSYGLVKALTEINKVKGTSAAAATSTLQPVSGDNGVYISQFTSPFWVGDLRKYSFNEDGTVSTSVIKDGVTTDTALWSAADKLKPETARTIYFFRPGSGSTGTLQNFDASNMLADEKALFSGACSKPVADRLSQCAISDATTVASLNSATDMVSYLRGQPKTGYRIRSAVLGDLVNSAPVFIGAPSFKYLENDYPTWAKSKADRKRVLLVGGNDGMLHAFKDNESDTDTTGGTELWAYVPRLTMGKMYKLADAEYSSKHQYFVDGSPVVSDIFVDGKWKSIVVGGLNGGGRGYYALDVTDPTAPKALWEFGPDNLGAYADRLGYSYGNPIVTKAKDGTWIVAFTSGYNNPDGGGYLFIVNANTGELIKTLATNQGSASDPSGLAKINAWIESTEENRALRFYGGDLTGRVYRFDFDHLLGYDSDVVELAQFIYKDPDSGSKTLQPITTMPMLAEFSANGAKRKVVYVGTGKYLGASDVPAGDKGPQQSIYAIVDELAKEGLGDVRAGSGLVKQPIDTTTTPRTVGSKDTLMDWSKKKGWFVDLASSLERVNIDMMLVANTLLAVGNVPGQSATDCADPESNSAWLYSFNIILGSGNAVKLDSLVAGLGAIQTAAKGDGTGGGDIVGVVTATTGEILSPKITPLTTSGEPARRTSWRELR